jgi:hypothetical protein
VKRRSVPRVMIFFVSTAGVWRGTIDSTAIKIVCRGDLQQLERRHIRHDGRHVPMFLYHLGVTFPGVGIVGQAIRSSTLYFQEKHTVPT